jgi:S1-C subfamily serine protease
VELWDVALTLTSGNRHLTLPRCCSLFVLVLTLLVLAGCGDDAPPAAISTPLGEESVRAIVREEVAKALAAQAATPSATCDITTAVSRALPSVVRVEVRRPGTQIVTGRGSGFVALAGGIVVTAAHVIGTAPSDLSLLTVDGRRMSAEVLKVDAVIDVAVLRAADRRLPPIRWADTAAVSLGEAVRIVGYPFGRPDVTVTGGVLARRIPAGPQRREELVTDADADPGNSGGPLLTACGEALGVVVQRVVTTATTTVAVGAGTVLPMALAAAAPPGTVSPTVTPIPTRSP